MNLFDNVLLSFILLSYPLLLYLLYIEKYKEKQNKIYFDIILITSFFLIYKYINYPSCLYSFFLLNIVALLPYLKKHYITSNIILIFNLLLFYKNFNFTFFLLFGYIIIFIMFLIKEKKGFLDIYFFISYLFINVATLIIWILLFNKEYFDIKSIVILLLIYFITASIIYMLFKIFKQIKTRNVKLIEMQNERKFQSSLFKITHEIKNPIAVCKCYLDMIDVNNKKDTLKYIPIIKSEIDRLLVLLQDFLLINKINLDLDVMDLNLLIEENVNKLNSLFKSKNIKLNMNLIDDEVYINGDYNRLSQVIINLLKNSIEAIDYNGKVNVRTYINKDMFCIDIVDNGCGIDKKTLTKIKDPFYTTKPRGSGLGVSLSYEIVEAHHGKLNYYSDLGRGTKVVLQIPLFE